ncbi:hypothetical protein Ssi02_76730 [Sinosporangium siamense]|uniref:Uncharacterized protein n=2 Tax=Sinosporangium siamense TaxID=1367973 RepID=A0A919VCB6_9ACTN|nr:hypothetical protein Ssi02_76730 [Sinosporangium siamense]
MPPPQAPQHAGPVKDPANPLRVKLHKWILFSLLLALLGILADLAAVALAEGEMTAAGILGKGELYLVNIGMLFSAAGELLYDRTRVETAAPWQITVCVLTLIVALVFAMAYAFVKAGKSSGEVVAFYSLITCGVSFVWGLILVSVSHPGRQPHA